MKSYTSIKPFLGFITLFIVLVVLSCKSSKTENERSQDLSALETKIRSKNFKIDITTVLPFNTNATTQVLNNLTRYTGNTADRIFVNGYFIDFKNDSIIGYLPFYGEQRLSSNRYNSDLGIEFSGMPQEFSLDKHKRKDAYVMQFTINDNRDTTETYKVFITFFPSNTADVNIVSSHRNSINYRGQLENAN
ncbi:hypothetical protein BWZ20_01675 [Winogradskyella sp. J14-2]|uniref:DUF4251 domain-containing protein n=1 Tax=Winogradskyella sp. J14-2 TaxID=1936080 RepID=UPI000972E64C|nr:DUF4251 domain-containing protein [Winogradskyella sp. J14-2]APY07089.1 hypothetical protein BWZ20_01675 [Winogradskyella sp. J14-2]